MVLKRWEVCHLIGFNSWTSVQVWLDEVAHDAFRELARDYLEPFRSRGEKNPPGNEQIKRYFVRFAEDFDRDAARRASERERGEVGGPGRSPPNKQTWETPQHYKRFIIEALAEDRLAARQSPRRSRNHIATKDWARDPVKLFANMYELTDAICHNFWKTAESDQWPSDDSDVPYTDGEDVPGARLGQL